MPLPSDGLMYGGASKTATARTRRINFSRGGVIFIGKQGRARRGGGRGQGNQGNLRASGLRFSRWAE